MAGGLTAAGQAIILRNIINSTSPGTMPSTELFIHLYNSTLTDAVTLATTGRCAGANYAPVSISNTTALWTNPGSTSPATVTNGQTIVLTTAASTGWGTIKAFTIASSSSTGSGTIYWWGDITPNQTISEGNAVQFSTGSLALILGGGSAT